MAKLALLADGGKTTFDLSESSVTSIGRLSANHIQLNDGSVSKHHAQIVHAGSTWRIEDLMSSNGVFVNGARVSSCLLTSGDIIHCGTVKLRFDAGHLTAVGPSDRLDESEIVASISVMRPMPPDDAGRPGRKGSDTVELSGMQSDEHPAEKKLRVVQMIAEKTIKTLDQDQLVDEILTIAMEQTGASRGFLCRLQPDGSYTPLATRGMRPDEEPRISRTVLKKLLVEKSGVLVSQGSSEDAVASMQAMDVSATLCVPLWTTDEIMGFISLDRQGVVNNFDRSDLDLLIAIGHQAAVGIERARLAKVAEQQLSVRKYLSQYLDNKLVQQIADARDGQRGDGADPLAPTERELTILFSDIVSFTKICEGMKPTDVAFFIRKYLTAMTEIIFSHGGTIDKYVGDAIMALFGAPMESANAARSAINAAIEMREFVEQMEPPSGSKHRLRVRFGIGTGQAVVGNIGSAQRVEYTALGDTVNLASRLESFARPKEICIDEHTLSKVPADDFIIQEIGTIDVKNRAQPVRVYKVIG